jgi:peptidoglycan/LPS O-acetylase OafA/YrhL
MMGAPRFRNFDTIRLVAAASVIFSHAYLICDGHERNEPFVRLTGHIIGIHGVFAFLIISGFLVTQSLYASPSLFSFAWKRFLRIYPALAVCAIASAFIIAPFFSALSWAKYVHSLVGVKYVAKVLLLFQTFDIPTVQFYDQDAQSLGHIINGSLWTIASEVYCYMILLVLAALKLVSTPIALIGLIAGSTLLEGSLLFPQAFSDTATNLVYTVPSFAAGVVMYFVHLRYGISKAFAFACCGALFLAAPTGLLMVLFPILACYPLIALGVTRSISLGNAARFGDLSYGTYLYGWPIEQVVRSLGGDRLSGLTLFLISLPLAAACGWLSWHLVEKHALALKNLAWRSKKLKTSC